ncbi:hypothetical protein NDU88_001345 [Pleurodeles waltl]|uniref:Uncharacterized protein n=1 Tax=Pleurodeles waltl TaxID=8319 RepID=A0AAV7L970_PLEWA|nr:hypothetical protein NDU88_001345 [Pleurodeles waltl]
MGAWGSCMMAGKERPEARAAPRRRNHPSMAAPRLAHLFDPDAGRTELGASLCWLCLYYPGSVAWPPPLYACGGTRQPESSMGTAVDLPGRRRPQYEDRPSAIAPGKWKETKKKRKMQLGLVPRAGELAACEADCGDHGRHISGPPCSPSLGKRNPLSFYSLRYSKIKTEE